MIVSAMLAFMGISGILGKINISGLEVDIKLPKEIYAKEDIPVKVSLKNRRRFLPAFLLRIKLMNKTGFITFIDRKSSKSTYITVRFDERGYILLKEVYICSIFPFNFFIRCRPYEINKKLLVFPGPSRCKENQAEIAGRKKTGRLISNKKGYIGDILYIRDYNYADPLKYIHWKASAKTGSLKTKEFSTDMSDPVIIDIDNFTGDLERKLSCAVFYVIYFFKKNIPFGLKLKNKLIKPEYSEKHKLRVLKELALYGKD